MTFIFLQLFLRHNPELLLFQCSDILGAQYHHWISIKDVLTLTIDLEI